MLIDREYKHVPNIEREKQTMRKNTGNDGIVLEYRARQHDSVKYRITKIIGSPIVLECTPEDEIIRRVGQSISEESALRLSADYDVTTIEGK
jgi:hypothetical protein